MTTRLVRRRRSSHDQWTEADIDEFMVQLSQRHEKLSAQFNMAMWFSHTAHGFHHLVFPALPDAVADEVKNDICNRWATKEIVPLGVACMMHRLASSVIFSFTRREVTKSGFGKVVVDIITDEFFASVRASFTAAVNDELKLLGLPSPDYS